MQEALSFAAGESVIVDTEKGIGLRKSRYRLPMKRRGASS